MHGLKYTPVASLKVGWKKIDMTIMDGKKQLKFAYERPFLEEIDAATTNQSVGKPLHRRREDFDDVENVKKEKKAKTTKKTFGLL